MIIRNASLIAVLLCVFPLVGNTSALLNDFSNPGPNEVISGEYQLPAVIDPLVTTELKTELWAAVFRPKKQPVAPWPLIVLLHGNHGTCGLLDAFLGIHYDNDITYTYEGNCPDGYTPVKSHRGYDYLASRLASWGYVVVSVNANRGINGAFGSEDDFSLNLRRGRLILSHLAALSQWTKNEKPSPTSLKFSLANTMNFSEVGLMGHSRGGEGMRAAWRLYQDANSPFQREIRYPLTVRAIFEIAPVDGQTPRTLDTDGLSSMILLSSCDGDVATLEGVHVFDRMLLKTPESIVDSPKRKIVRGTFNMLGGNHNFYNTEWQTSDSDFCLGHPAKFPAYAGSVYQRITAINTVIPFFLGTVGSQRKFSVLKVFDPLTPISGPLLGVGGLGKGFVHSNAFQDRSVLVRFDAAKPESFGIRHVVNNVTVSHVPGPPEHDPAIRAAQIDWSKTNTGFFKPTNIDIAIASAQQPLSLLTHELLGFRLTSMCFDTACDTDWFKSPKLDAAVSLIDAAGRESSPALSLAASTDLRRPVGAPQGGFDESKLHNLLQNAYFRTQDFKGVDLANIKKVRLSFNPTSSGRLLLTEINLQNDALQLSRRYFTYHPKTIWQEVSSEIELKAWRDSQSTAKKADLRVPENNKVLSVSRFLADAQSISTSTPKMQVKITLYSSRRFPVVNSLPEVTVGNSKAIRVRQERGGGLIAQFLAEDYDQQNSSASLQVKIGAQPIWNFGAKPK